MASPPSAPQRRVVQEDEAGTRLDAFLSLWFPWRSRQQLVGFLTEDRVRLNGAPAKKSRRVASGDVVEMRLPPAADSTEALLAIPLRILFEDEDLVAVDKPSGVAVHPAAGCHEVNMLRRLEHHYGSLEHGEPAGRGGAPEGGASVTPSIVHRLDRATSGVIVYAKRRELVAFYTGQFEARSVDKTYLALVHGEIRSAGSWRWGLRVDDAVNVQVDADGKPSHTDFEPLEHAAGTTLVRVMPHTGRKHQIRVHFAHGGHPLVFDDLYGVDGQPDVWPAGARLGLHAAQLELDHRNGERLRIEASIPEALQRGLRG